MKLIVGLGNPGEKYKNTRHNVGFKVIDVLAREMGGDKWAVSRKHQSLFLLHPKVIFAKPQTYMNSSGEAVSELVNFYKVYLSDLWVIHDDLDIILGQYKIQFGVGPKVHNGVNSVEERLGINDFWRVRIGVDNRFQKFPNSNFQVTSQNQTKISKATNLYRVSGEEYVLKNFTREEKDILDEVVEKVVKDLIDRLK